MISRRSILMAAGTAAALGLWPGVPVRAGAAARAGAQDAVAGELATALRTSDTVYLTPLKADGSESACQAEVWFVADGSDVCVVTAVGAWRARAVRGGLREARMWVGDLGVWTRSEGRYRALPQLQATGEFVTATAEQGRVLELFGSKYPVSWVLWGPRFRDGLADGSRVMLRYRPVAG